MSLHGPHSSNAAQRGLTIVELMVSMTVGLLVLSLVTYTYMLNKQSWKFNEQDARIQDRGRYVMSMMNADLRLAGYRGCQRSTTPSLGAVGNLANLLDKGVDVAQNGDATKKLTIYGPVAGGNFSLTSALAVNDEPTAIAVSALTPDMI
ncbi:MAG: prepilin-type N-terminal cleavage/methylation domain-containing protein, partial [Azoarcus sp.]|nr:prepilin-type N-terminal cleavage/methylation domain-containing protein [Azoarcus sp.]